MATITVHKGTQIREQHNKRNKKVTDKETHIHDKGEVYTNARGQEQIADYEVWQHRTQKQAVKMFDKVLEEYNLKQKKHHPERVIYDYIDYLKKHNQNFAYEIIYQVTPEEDETITQAQSKEILRQVYEHFKSTYRQFRIIGAYYHADEDGCPHLHLDYVPIATSPKKGPKVLVSQTKALEQMGYTFEKAQEKKVRYADTLFLNDERDNLISICENKGIHIHELKEDRPHLNTKDYKAAQKEKEELLKEIENLKIQIADMKDKHSKERQFDLIKKRLEDEKIKNKDLQRQVDKLTQIIQELTQTNNISM